MSRNPFLLDTSALLTLIEDEAGAKRVQEIFRQEQTLIPWTALMEIHYITEQEKGRSEAEARYAMLRHSGAEILWEMDEATVLLAAGFKAQYRVSFADAVIAAYAIRREATLVHKDPEYETLTDSLRIETLPYKE